MTQIKDSPKKDQVDSTADNTQITHTPSNANTLSELPTYSYERELKAPF